jgi:hypothetical protein
MATERNPKLPIASNESPQTQRGPRVAMACRGNHLPLPNANLYQGNVLPQRDRIREVSGARGHRLCKRLLHPVHRLDLRFLLVSILHQILLESDVDTL